MIKSMTGYGRVEIADAEKKVCVELKSVNHKYMDVSIKMPRKLIQFENDIRNILKEYATRGKIDVFITYEDMSSESSALKFDEALAEEYFKYYKLIGERFSVTDDIKISSIARSPEVLTLEEQDVDEKALWSILEPAVREAFKNFRISREKEGLSLKNDILDKLNLMSEHVNYIEDRLPSIIAEFRSKLEIRVKELLDSSMIDESRIAAEVTLYADKVAIDEEIVRLKTHIANMKDLLTTGGDKGRNLDFLAQEMNRESNTILSKSNDIEVTNRGIELKTCIEKIREQVQNIE